MTTSYMGYTRIFTHRGHTRERACASARVINCSLIYGRFLFKFGVNILHLTISSKGYVRFMFTHRAHACECVCERARGLTINYFWTNRLQMWCAHTTNDHKLHGIHTYHVQSLRACESVHVRARVWLSAHLWTDSLQIWWGHKTDPHRLHALFNVCECMS
jgi:hypothetical protein